MVAGDDEDDRELKLVHSVHFKIEGGEDTKQIRKFSKKIKFNHILRTKTRDKIWEQAFSLTLPSIEKEMKRCWLYRYDETFWNFREHFPPYHNHIYPISCESPAKIFNSRELLILCWLLAGRNVKGGKSIHSK